MPTDAAPPVWVLSYVGKTTGMPEPVMVYAGTEADVKEKIDANWVIKKPWMKTRDGWERELMRGDRLIIYPVPLVFE